MRDLLVRCQACRMNARPPADLPDDQHVRVVPVAGAGVLLVAVLVEPVAGHAAPTVANVSGGPPAVAPDFGAPFPDLAHSVLAETEDDIAAALVERLPHHAV